MKFPRICEVDTDRSLWRSTGSRRSKRLPLLMWVSNYRVQSKCYVCRISWFIKNWKSIFFQTKKIQIHSLKFAWHTQRLWNIPLWTQYVPSWLCYRFTLYVLYIDRGFHRSNKLRNSHIAFCLRAIDVCESFDVEVAQTCEYQNLHPCCPPAKENCWNLRI